MRSINKSCKDIFTIKVKKAKKWLKKRIKKAKLSDYSRSSISLMRLKPQSLNSLIMLYTSMKMLRSSLKIHLFCRTTPCWVTHHRSQTKIAKDLIQISISSKNTASVSASMSEIINRINVISKKIFRRWLNSICVDCFLCIVQTQQECPLTLTTQFDKNWLILAWKDQQIKMQFLKRYLMNSMDPMNL